MEWDEKKLGALKVQADALLGALEGFVDSCKDMFTRMDLDELAKFYSNLTDKLILKKEAEENLKYVGGTFSIVYVTQETFSLKLELYFQDAEQEWVAMKSTSAKPVKYLKERALKELFEKKKVSYDVEKPDTNPKESAAAE